MNNLFIPTPTGTLSCTTTGSTTPVNPPTLTKKLACTANAVGGGCTNGQVCAPLGTQQCVLAAGSHACPSGYPSGMTWYTSITDNRSCSCSCTPSSCASARPRGYTQLPCSGAGTAPPGAEICSNDFMYWKLGGPSCAPSSSLGGTSIQFNGASTVCCE